jgi:protein required for attachment to host cells
MTEQLVAAVDGARARVFSVGERTTPQGEKKKTLEEIETLINPAHRTKDGDLYSDSRPGSRQSMGTAHGVDDKREAHNAEFDRKFAQLVMDKLRDLARSEGARAVVLAAGPRMMGHLRDRKVALPNVVVGELPKHLTELSAHDLCRRLEDDGVI